MKAGMGKGRLSFHLSACFLISFSRLLTSPGSSVPAFFFQPDSDNILQGLPNIVDSQSQSPVFCKSNSQSNYESVECIVMSSFFCCLETVKHLLRHYADCKGQLSPASFDAVCTWLTTSWQAATVTLGWVIWFLLEYLFCLLLVPVSLFTHVGRQHLSEQGLLMKIKGLLTPSVFIFGGGVNS